MKTKLLSVAVFVIVAVTFGPPIVAFIHAAIAKVGVLLSGAAS